MSTKEGVRPDVQEFGPPNPRRPVKPSSAWYVIAALVGAVGLAISLAWGLTTYFDYRDEIQGFVRMDAPGTSALVLDAGAQTVYVEGSGVTAAADVTITAPDSTVVPTTDYSGDLRYDAPDGSVGTAVATVTIPTSGTYDVAVQGLTGTLAIGPSVTSSMIAAAIGAAFLALGSIAAMIAIIVVTAIKRSKADAIVVR